MNPPTPVTTPTSVASHVYYRRTLGDEKEAKHYIQKIRHETLRISVIQRLEEYLNLDNSRVPTPPVTEPEATASDDDDDDEAGNPRPPSPTEPQIGMWVDHCKHLFLWYYDIYLVLSSPFLSFFNK